MWRNEDAWICRGKKGNKIPLQINLSFHGFTYLVHLVERLENLGQLSQHYFILPARNFILLTEILFPFSGISTDPICLFRTFRNKQEVTAGEFCAGQNGVARLCSPASDPMVSRLSMSQGANSGRTDLECDSVTDRSPLLISETGKFTKP